MKLDKKDIIIFVLCIAVGVLSYVSFGGKETVYDDKFTKEELKRLEEKNKQLWSEVGVLEAGADKKQKRIDSLESLKPTIVIQYEKRYKQIDNASAISVVNQFKDIFAKDSIR
jgi:hypothetical protein